MKNLFLVASVLLYFSNFSFAQTPDVTAQKSETRFGVKAALIFSNFVGDDAGDTKTLTSFSGGFFGTFKLGQKLYLQPEILYSLQGARQNLIIEGTNVKAELRTNYVTIPIMLKYYFVNDFSLEAGPYIGFLTSAKVKFASPFGSGTEDIDEIFKSTDFGLGLGFNYDATDNVFLNARYSFGLTQIGDAESDNNVKNSVIQFALGIRF